MKEKLIHIRANRVVSKYKTYADFSRLATSPEKKVVLQSTILEANKLQRQTAGIK